MKYQLGDLVRLTVWTPGKGWQRLLAWLVVRHTSHWTVVDYFDPFGARYRINKLALEAAA